MEIKPYYYAYEKRYRAVYESGADRWGHSPNDNELYCTLQNWVTDNKLQGKKIIEFACGEGASGVILSELGCIYHGVDISPSAIEKASQYLKNFHDASVSILDMVNEITSEKYDAALDSMGYHMLVTDCDRRNYLENAFSSLNSGSPMLFYKESYRNSDNCNKIVKSPVNSYEDWLNITGDDYETPSVRQIETSDGEVEIMIPLVPSRANDRIGYIHEMESVGFLVEKFVEMKPSSSIQCAASIYVRKP